MEFAKGVATHRMRAESLCLWLSYMAHQHESVPLIRSEALTIPSIPFPHREQEGLAGSIAFGQWIQDPRRWVHIIWEKKGGVSAKVPLG